MLNYWFVSRPKRKLNSIPEVLALFSELSLNQQWSGQTSEHRSYEEALERAGLKRVGDRRDQGGSGGRTYAAWLKSLGLIFKQNSTGQIRLTYAGEAIMNGDSPVSVLTWQILKFQYPSSYSISRGVEIAPRFHVHPFVFILRLLADDRVQYLTLQELGRVVCTFADSDSDKCLQQVIDRVLSYRDTGVASLPDNYFENFSPAKGKVNPEHPFSHLDDIANTMMNWIEYTQLAKRDEDSRLSILPEQMNNVYKIIGQQMPFINRPEDEEYFQRKYGLAPGQIKDTRDLNAHQTITDRIIIENQIRKAYISISVKHPIIGVDAATIKEIADETGANQELVEKIISTQYPHGAIGAFLSSYFEMAFKGTEEATDFEIATADLFRNVFKFDARHFGQGGSKSVPDVLVLSGQPPYQGVIDNKAYGKYSVTGDHHNRMVHNYLEKIETYSDSTYPIGFFMYIAGGFISTIDRQIKSEVQESGVHGSCITVNNFIQMITNQTSGEKTYTHEDLLRIFSLDRQILLKDI